MLRRKENLLGRQSRAQDVQGEVCLDNPSVVIDRMTDIGIIARSEKSRSLASLVMTNREIAGYFA